MTIDCIVLRRRTTASSRTRVLLPRGRSTTARARRRGSPSSGQVTTPPRARLRAASIGAAAPSTVTRRDGCSSPPSCLLRVPRGLGGDARWEFRLVFSESMNVIEGGGARGWRGGGGGGGCLGPFSDPSSQAARGATARTAACAPTTPFQTTSSTGADPASPPEALPFPPHLQLRTGAPCPPPRPLVASPSCRAAASGSRRTTLDPAATAPRAATSRTPLRTPRGASTTAARRRRAFLSSSRPTTW